MRQLKCAGESSEIAALRAENAELGAALYQAVEAMRAKCEAIAREEGNSRAHLSRATAFIIADAIAALRLQPPGAHPGEGVEPIKENMRQVPGRSA